MPKAPILSPLEERLLAQVRRDGRQTLETLTKKMFGLVRPSPELVNSCRTALFQLRVHGLVGCSVEDDVAYYWLFPNRGDTDSLVQFLMKES